MPPLDVRITVRIVDDAAAPAALRRAWTEEDAGPLDDPGFEAEFAVWWDREHDTRTTWVAFADGQPIGMLNMLEFRRMPRPGLPTGRWGYIANVFVLAARRNTGVGRLLLDTAIDEARSRGYVRLVLSPSARSIPFYRRAGFAAAADELLLLPLDPPS